MILLANTVLTRQLHFYWQSFKFFTKIHSCIELWAITLQERNSDPHSSLNNQEENMPISRNVSTGFPCQFTGGKHAKKSCLTLKMYLSRVTQLLVNVSVETEICLACCVLLEQCKSTANWKLAVYLHLTVSCVFSRSFKSNFVDPFFPNT